MPPFVPARCAARAAALALALTCTGCASVRVDEQGRTHVVGLVWLTLPAPATADRGAEQVRTRSLGVTLARHPLESAVVLGWSDRSISAIEPDRAVRLPALEP